MKINNVGMTGVNPYNLQVNKKGISRNQRSNPRIKLKFLQRQKEMQQESKMIAARQAKVDELKIQIEKEIIN
ncbi:flagellar biosynthesis anti-sigma factor FlgM [[Brevibacterium] frigoritolerans]|uniref:Flagellar biosynthesis anti-sigma factor FlgM n=1 Tax=Peribacillus frigoritolerans TaxID=450367 RepID=A0A941FMM7_9BACI|nr:flagellar biosynthesis anti-sigma factor FlgM [Peribacillus frigoritolerans]